VLPKAVAVVAKEEKAQPATKPVVVVQQKVQPPAPKVMEPEDDNYQEAEEEEEEAARPKNNKQPLPEETGDIPDMYKHPKDRNKPEEDDEPKYHGTLEISVLKNIQRQLQIERDQQERVAALQASQEIMNKSKSVLDVLDSIKYQNMATVNNDDSDNDDDDDPPKSSYDRLMESKISAYELSDNEENDVQDDDDSSSVHSNVSDGLFRGY
jgi:hypothetical protein